MFKFYNGSSTEKFNSMKKLYFSLCFMLIGSLVLAQNSFQKSIQENSVKLEKASTVHELDALFINFANLVTTQTPERWKAYYLAAQTQYKKAEILIREDQKSAAAEAHAVAQKYLSGGVPADQKDGKKLMELLAIQKSKLH